MMKWNQILYSGIVALAVLVTACADDLGLDGNRIGVGDAFVSVTVAFDREDVEGLGTRAATGGDPGTIIKDIETLYMLVYDRDGNLCKDDQGKDMVYPLVMNGKAVPDADPIDGVSYNQGDNRTEEEKDKELQDSVNTGQVTYNFRLQSGYYHIYAVANVDVIGLGRKAYAKREDLKQVEFKWDETDTKENSQMFGIFSIEPNRNASDGTVLPVAGNTTSLHCWLRRLASKVTVAFDGSDLYDNVQVYITDISIKDIPKYCTLGIPNTPCYHDRSADEITQRNGRYDTEHGVFKAGKSITLQTLDTEDLKMISPDKYLHVCNTEHPYFGIGEDGGSLDTPHDHKALSLFFYENMQGNGKSKKQSISGDTISFPHPDINKPESGWKDEKAYGTYVEVKGYYRCIAANAQMGSGPITYRYMLGQKSENDDNYDAVRNTHYKLTLKFKGYGNDADWHIDYEEHPGIYTSTPQYISYLYNKQMMATVKVVGKMSPNSRLYAEIVGVGKETLDWTKAREAGETFWRPWGDDTEAFPDPIKHENPVTPFYDYPSSVSMKAGMAPGGTRTPYYYRGAWENGGWTKNWGGDSFYEDGPWNSFLSLKATDRLILKDPNPPSPALQSTYNKDYFGTSGKGTRDYCIDKGPHDELGSNDVYRVEYTKMDGNEPTERVFYIPLYTRAKELVSETGYTGNNPFVAYPRKAKIKFWAEVMDPDDNNKLKKQEIYLDIIQVRRVVNPKGIWRKKNTKNKDFHVTLLRMPEDKDGTDFVSFISQGGWCADIQPGGDNIITLTSTPEGSAGGAPQAGLTHIEGSAECPIDFKINFNGTEGCAIVKVRYHNYTCEHDIFCSVGDKPVKLIDAKEGQQQVWWHKRNVYSFNADGSPNYTETPMEEGSLFRRGNNTAILATNNIGNGIGKTRSSFEVLKAGAQTTENLGWDALAPDLGDGADTDKGRFRSWKIPNENERIATSEDYYTLVSNELSFPIKQAYGVLYGDGATGVKTKQSDAYGFMREDGENSDKGMRGCFVYNRNTCQHIFLPISASGHGHRKHSGGWRNYDDAGALRYASRSYPYDYYDYGNMKYVPLFYDLYRRPGAIYWCRDRHLNSEGSAAYSGEKSSAFDINYFTMAFKGYNNDGATDDNGSNAHACFIRTVYTKDPDK